MMHKYVLQNIYLTLKGYVSFEPLNTELYSHDHTFNATDLSLIKKKLSDKEMVIWITLTVSE